MKQRCVSWLMGILGFATVIMLFVALWDSDGNYREITLPIALGLALLIFITDVVSGGFGRFMSTLRQDLEWQRIIDDAPKRFRDLSGYPIYINSDGTKVWPAPTKNVRLVTLAPYDKVNKEVMTDDYIKVEENGDPLWKFHRGSWQSRRIIDAKIGPDEQSLYIKVSK